MKSLAVGLLAGALLGLAVGWLTWSPSRSPAGTSPTVKGSSAVGAADDAPARTPRLQGVGSPAIAPSPADELLRAHEERIRALEAERAGLMSELARGREAAQRSAFETARAREIDHLTKDPALSRDQLAAAARIPTTTTGQFQQFVVALPENDLGAYLDGVWAARLDAMARMDVRLEPTLASELGSVWRREWLAYRAWARSTLVPHFERATSPADLDAARLSNQVAISQGGAARAQAVQRLIDAHGLDASTASTVHRFCD